MRVVVAPDSFKGSLSATQVAAAISRGWRQSQPDSDCVELPLADGGEGTVATLVAALGGTTVICPVEGPYGDPVDAPYGLIERDESDGPIAVIEMAAASGLGLARGSLDVGKASSYGTGQLIADALDRGVVKVILGLGGSATNDGGAGMAQALGVELIGPSGSLERGATGLMGLERIDMSGIHPGVAGCEFVVASDVEAPLTGPTGASAIFGPQKGASVSEVAELDRGLANLASVVGDLGSEIDPNQAGAGAAGGLGFAAMAFLGATIDSGIGLVMSLLRFEEMVATADLVVTGEGRLDAQTLSGKVAMGVLRVALASDTPAIALVGCVGEGSVDMERAGMTAIFPIVDAPGDLESALLSTEANLERVARNVASLWATAVVSRVR